MKYKEKMMKRKMMMKGKMMRTYLAAAGLLSFVASLALAAEFYVAQDTDTKKCVIVDTKPDGKKWVMIGTSSYATKVEAKEARAQTTLEQCPHNPHPKAP